MKDEITYMIDKSRLARKTSMVGILDSFYSMIPLWCAIRHTMLALIPCLQLEQQLTIRPATRKHLYNVAPQKKKRN